MRMWITVGMTGIRVKKRRYKSPLMTARVNPGLLMQFDATVKAQGIDSRTKALELLMRAFNNGNVKLPKPIGYDPITHEPIWEREKK